MAVLEAARTGELRHEGRQKQGIVVLGGDLNGLVVLILAHLDGVYGRDIQGGVFCVSSAARLHCVASPRSTRCPPRDVTSVLPPHSLKLM
ncbi:hypothetical protein E2C01_028422 [Portunus trituberculatus]|uniref:Uncharacterized protein n=1 Tax=Portunus trituberculatus TaxID=210409 RepID=A0A5B7EP33_PORTR|nr:hypothetical protein [Portunus trituberculatus]